MHRSMRRGRSAGSFEQLESRILFSTITWVNRGQASDRFGEVFGANANLARGVIDEAITRWQRVITDFNYIDGTNTYQLSVAMRSSGTGNGGQGGATAFIGVGDARKPSAGTIVFDRGDNLFGDPNGDGGGWYLDPVPTDDAEFTGTLYNAFARGSVSGTDPFGQSDLMTVAMHELGHALGLDANDHTQDFATDTGIPDNQGHGGAHFWAFEGPSVSHLFTGWDSGGGGNDAGGTQHSARDGASIFYNGQTWEGASDLMTAIYQTSRRKTVDNVTAWVLHDSWGYDITEPETFGTTYSSLNRATGQLTIRGGATGTQSDDTITVGLFGPLLVTSIDVGEDVPGTGPLPGAGNLDAFTSIYSAADVTSIVILGDDGNDTVIINSTSTGVGISVDGGTGNDTLTLGNGDLDTNLNGPITFVGGTGTDQLILDDTTDGAGSDSYSFSTTTLAKPAGDPISWSTIEGIILNASPNSDTITVTGTLPGNPLTVNARNGNDTINVQGTDTLAPVTITTGSGSDTVNVNTDDTGTALALFPASESVTALNIGVGGRLALAQAAQANSRTLITQSLSIDNGGVLDLTNGSMIVDYNLASPLTAVSGWIASGRNGGTWTGSGITSFAAFLANPKNTTLGVMESTDFKAIYGNAAPFSGQPIDATSVLVKYTYYGDTDFNGQVNFDDYVRTDNGFNNHRTGWLNGDFDGNGQVNFDDYVLIDLAFNTQSGVLHRGGRAD